MQANVTRIIATIIVSTLFAASAAVAEDKDAAATKPATTSDTTELNKDRARTATIAAAEDAIEAVLAANKLRLDIRLIGRTSAQMADSR